MERISIYSNNCNVVTHSSHIKDVGTYKCPEEKVSKSACKSLEVVKVVAVDNYGRVRNGFRIQ